MATIAQQMQGIFCRICRVASNLICVIASKEKKRKEKFRLFLQSAEKELNNCVGPLIDYLLGLSTLTNFD